MSKTTKIIAALGVVAGLGVAALPAFTYAADPVSTTGNVDVVVEVQPAIAMTIAGNNDNMSHYGEYTYSAVTPEGTENPQEEGWYVSDGADGYELTSDTTVQSGTTYYSRSGGYRAVDSFAPATAAGSIIDGHTTPATSITGVSSSYASMLPNSVYNGNDTNGFKSTIKVYTNNTTGYTLKVKDADSTLALTKTDGTATIAALAADGDLIAGTPAWGYKVDSASDDGTGYKAITATDVQVKTKATKTSGGEETVVYYGVATDDDQATGVYTDTIIYTATTNN